MLTSKTQKSFPFSSRHRTGGSLNIPLVCAFDRPIYKPNCIRQMSEGTNNRQRERETGRHVRLQYG